MIISAVAIMSVMVSCHKDKAEPVPPVAACDTLQVSFANDIQPIFDAHCNNAGCHDAITQAHGNILETHGQISAQAENSYRAMNHEAGYTAMPLGNPTKLPDSLLNKMNCWIQDGKPNN